MLGYKIDLSEIIVVRNSRDKKKHIGLRIASVENDHQTYALLKDGKGGQGP